MAVCSKQSVTAEMLSATSNHPPARNDPNSDMLLTLAKNVSLE